MLFGSWSLFRVSDFDIRVADRSMRPALALVVDLDEADAGAAAFASQNGGEGAGRQRDVPDSVGSSDWSLVHVVDVDEVDAGGAALSSQDGGEGARRQRDMDAGLGGIGGSQPERRQLRGRGRVVLPVVVRNQECAVTVAQLEGGIGQHRTQT